MRIDVREVERVARRMRLGAEEVVGSLVMDAAQTMKAKAVERTPVDTGVMQKAWHIKKTAKLTAVVENKAHYASFVEFGRRNRFGGRFVPGQKFMTTAMIETEEVLPKLAKRQLKDWLGGVFA